MNKENHREKLEALNRESVRQLEECLKSKGDLKEDGHLKVVKAHDEWQQAWNKLMETLLVLEKLEL